MFLISPLLIYPARRMGRMWIAVPISLILASTFYGYIMARNAGILGKDILL